MFLASYKSTVTKTSTSDKPSLSYKIRQFGMMGMMYKNLFIASKALPIFSIITNGALAFEGFLHTPAWLYKEGLLKINLKSNFTICLVKQQEQLHSLTIHGKFQSFSLQF